MATSGTDPEVKIRIDSDASALIAVLEVIAKHAAACAEDLRGLIGQACLHGDACVCDHGRIW